MNNVDVGGLGSFGVWGLGFMFELFEEDHVDEHAIDYIADHLDDGDDGDDGHPACLWTLQIRKRSRSRYSRYGVHHR